MCVQKSITLFFYYHFYTREEEKAKMPYGKTLYIRYNVWRAFLFCSVMLYWLYKRESESAYIHIHLPRSKKLLSRSGQKTLRTSRVQTAAASLSLIPHISRTPSTNAAFPMSPPLSYQSLTIDVRYIVYTLPCLITSWYFTLDKYLLSLLFLLFFLMFNNLFCI